MSLFCVLWIKVKRIRITIMRERPVELEMDCYDTEGNIMELCIIHVMTSCVGVWYKSGIKWFRVLVLLDVIDKYNYYKGNWILMLFTVHGFEQCNRCGIDW